MEVWRDVKGYEGLYQVSNLGNVKSLSRLKQNHSKKQLIPEKLKSFRVDPQGYLMLDLYKNNKPKTFRVHRLVAETFIQNDKAKETVNHIDGDKSNNRVDNLEWATFKEQNSHFYENKLKSQESIDKAVSAMTKATSKKVICLNTGEIFNSASEAARYVGISPSLIMRCCRGERKSGGKGENGNPLHWQYVSE